MSMMPSEVPGGAGDQQIARVPLGRLLLHRQSCAFCCAPMPHPVGSKRIMHAHTRTHTVTCARAPVHARMHARSQTRTGTRARTCALTQPSPPRPRCAYGCWHPQQKSRACGTGAYGTHSAIPLGSVIAILGSLIHSCAANKESHVPYRNSKLTCAPPCHSTAAESVALRPCCIAPMSVRHHLLHSFGGCRVHNSATTTRVVHNK